MHIYYGQIIRKNKTNNTACGVCVYLVALQDYSFVHSLTLSLIDIDVVPYGVVCKISEMFIYLLYLFQ